VTPLSDQAGAVQENERPAQHRRPDFIFAVYINCIYSFFNLYRSLPFTPWFLRLNDILIQAAGAE